jgi:hypothetical protein
MGSVLCAKASGILIQRMPFVKRGKLENLENENLVKSGKLGLMSSTPRQGANGIYSTFHPAPWAGLGSSRLPYPYFWVIEMRAGSDLTFREIGPLLHCTEDAAKKMYYRGLRILRKKLRVQQ